MTSPHDALDQHVRSALQAIPKVDTSTRDVDWSAFDAMAGSRHLDLEARRLRERGQGFYTIGSAGHESNALVAQALRTTDPALLHYRSGAFYLARSLSAGRSLTEGLRDVLLGLMASTADPASGGRHKVFGHPDLAVIPQTSTIASHLPRAVGVAFAIGRARRLRVDTRWPRDAVAVTSFGDASLNHSTAVGALNTAGYCAYRGLPLPLLFVCEDNGWGISVPTPSGWVAQAAHRPQIEYFAAAGDEPDALAEVAARAVSHARGGRPALLHLRTVRYLAHAGTDVEEAYRPAIGVREDLHHDPVIAEARRLVDLGIDPSSVAERYERIGAEVTRLANELAVTPRLMSADEVTAPLAPSHPSAVAQEASRRADPAARRRVFADRLPEAAGPLTLAQSINAALTDALATRPEMTVFGEDTGVKGGVYGVTRGLVSRFGAPRVFDTLLDEQAILGLALGQAVSGLLPVPEIQYLAYLHNALDQLRGEAASLQFFSNGTYRNGMVVRVQGLAYQKGFGGHFHNDNAVAALRDIPGLAVHVPSRADEAPGLLTAALGAAVCDGLVSVQLEPIALYHERDLYEPGDREWMAQYPASTTAPAIGTARTHGDGTDLTMVTFGNGVRMSLRVARRLADIGVTCRVVDLRWIQPLPVADILREANATGRVLAVDETRHSGGVGEGVVTALVEAGYSGALARVASVDSFVPLGDAANLVLLGEAEIEAAARALLR